MTVDFFMKNIAISSSY